MMVLCLKKKGWQQSADFFVVDWGLLDPVVSLIVTVAGTTARASATKQ